MAFKKGLPVVIIFPPTQINSPQIYRGVVIKVEGSKERPNIVVAPLQAGMGHMNFSGVTGRGMGTDAFIVDHTFVEWTLKD